MKVVSKVTCKVEPCLNCCPGPDPGLMKKSVSGLYAATLVARIDRKNKHDLMKASLFCILGYWAGRQGDGKEQVILLGKRDLKKNQSHLCNSTTARLDLPDLICHKLMIMRGCSHTIRCMSHKYARLGSMRCGDRSLAQNEP